MLHSRLCCDLGAGEKEDCSRRTQRFTSARVKVSTVPTKSVLVSSSDFREYVSIEVLCSRVKSIAATE